MANYPPSAGIGLILPVPNTGEPFSTVAENANLTLIDGAFIADRARLASLETLGDSWQSWTPKISGATTDPTLGTGGSAVGKYTRIGNTVFGQAVITFGSSGVAAGSGTYSLSLPLPVDGGMNGLYIGQAYWVPSGSQVGVIANWGLLNGAGNTSITLTGTVAGSGTTTPAAGMHVVYFFQYQCTP